MRTVVVRELRAKLPVANMTLEEKDVMLHGGPADTAVNLAEYASRQGLVNADDAAAGLHICSTTVCSGQSAEPWSVLQHRNECVPLSTALGR